MGLIGTRSLDKALPGLKQIYALNRERVKVGVKAVKLLEALRKNPQDAALREAFDEVRHDLGFRLLLIVEMYLMVKFARQSPGSLGTGRYVNETQHAHA